MFMDMLLLKARASKMLSPTSLLLKVLRFTMLLLNMLLLDLNMWMLCTKTPCSVPAKTMPRGVHASYSIFVAALKCLPRQLQQESQQEAQQANQQW